MRKSKVDHMRQGVSANPRAAMSVATEFEIRTFFKVCKSTSTCALAFIGRGFALNEYLRLLVFVILFAPCFGRENTKALIPTARLRSMDQQLRILRLLSTGCNHCFTETAVALRGVTEIFYVDY